MSSSSYSSDSDSEFYSDEEQEILFNECRTTMQKQRLEIFKQQDLENGRFDVTFEIEGKILHAHQFTITSVSETMDAWLSNRWTSKDEIIKIQDYSYDNFYEFLRFLYISDCNLTEKNVFQMVDMAEFYGVQCLKDVCDKFLSECVTLKNAEELFEFAQKYSLPILRKYIRLFFVTRIEEVCNSEVFISFKKAFVKYLFAYPLKQYKHEYNMGAMFKGTYELAKKQSLKKQELFPVENFNLDNSIKANLVDVFPYVELSKMSTEFLLKFVVANGIISEEQANHVSDTVVQIKNNGKTICGMFKDDILGILLAFKKNRSCVAEQKLRSPKLRFSTLKFKVPKIPSTLTKMKGCEWYLCLEADGILTFKHQSIIQKSNYLIAEMKSSEEFKLTPGKVTSITAFCNYVL
uniref:BTB domain-containing protein n=1 Tax=Panagrolaimus sp. ES5 TaxID=591445 RepID=A0AC34G2N8_9BILA